MAKKNNRGKRVVVRTILIILVSLVVLTGLGGWFAYKYVVKSTNLNLSGRSTAYFYIYTGSTYDQVIDSLYDKGYIINKNTFEWMLEQKNYKNHVHPGRYLLKANMNNDELIDLLRSGEQQPVKVTFNTVRTKDQLAKKVAEYIEATEDELYEMLDSRDLANEYGFSREKFITMFLPNTYEFYWNTSAEQFVERMAKEYKTFWNEKRVAKAEKLGLSQSDVTILASIVQSEQSRRREEWPTIAGLYINRLKKGMPLQSDPTLIFALGNFSIRRVLNSHKEIDSPYNTYKNTGLPPGPILLPSIHCIDAVLNYERNNYLFMCAKADLSGYHHFAATYDEHLVYARQYRDSLNQKGIYK